MFTPARIVVLDDQPAHLEAISRTITALGSSCVCLTYSDTEDPPVEPFARARIIFMDLQLLDRQITSDMNRHFAEIQRLLIKLINPDGGPYLLIVWTDKPNQVSELGDYLEQNLYPRHPHTRPVQLLSMSKTEFIDLGSGTAKDPKALRAHILQMVESVPALAALLRWEIEIIEASDRVLGDVLQLAAAEPGAAATPDVGAALRRLAVAAVGEPNVRKDARAAIHSALLPLLEDHVQYRSVMESSAADGARDTPTPAPDAPSAPDPRAPETPAPEQTTPTDRTGPIEGGEPDSPTTSGTGTDGLTGKGAGAPPTNGDPDLLDDPDAPVDSRGGEHKDVWDAALAGPDRLPDLSRAQAADLNAHLHLGGAGPNLTAIMWGAICELEDDVDWAGELGIESGETYANHILGALKDPKKATKPSSQEVRPLQIRIGASCDYAQKTDGPIPYVVAAFVPIPQHAGRISVGGHKLAEGSHCWISPLIDLEGFGIGHLVADPRFTRTRGQDRACQFRAVNRIREQLLMQLISSVARHGDRPGIVSVDGSDPPTAQEHPDQA